MCDYLDLVYPLNNTHNMPKAKLGSGKRFKKLVKQLRGEGAKTPKALAAFIGRKKYGSKKFTSLEEKGKSHM